MIYITPKKIEALVESYKIRNKILTMKAVAESLGISRQYLYMIIKNGGVWGRKVNKVMEELLKK